MEKLTREELKELMKLFYMEGVKAGKRSSRLNEIPMGSTIIQPASEFEKFFNKTFNS